jgi:hypothetical protein
MFARVAATAGLLIGVPVPAFSQTGGCPDIGAFSGSQVSRTQSVFTFGFPQTVPKGVAGAPFSGQMSVETVRTLANGSHLTRPIRLQPMIYRDAMGRTRTDPEMTQLGSNVGPQISRLAEISDSVAGYRYIIDDFHKIAHRMTACVRALSAGGPAAGPPPAVAARGVTMTTDQLGTQVMSGVTVTGTRQTTTFPPGTYQSNDGPVTRVSEEWHSAQYGLNFLSKSTTPDGETTQTMTKFMAGEPDPALFQVPAGYQIVDETQKFSITIPYSGR